MVTERTEWGGFQSLTIVVSIMVAGDSSRASIVTVLDFEALLPGRSADAAFPAVVL